MASECQAPDWAVLVRPGVASANVRHLAWLNRFWNVYQHMFTLNPLRHSLSSASLHAACIG